jgi:iduronate 2-sulfatase
LLSKRLPPPVETANPAVRPAPAKPKIDRVALFERKDRNADGKLSREEFLANQPDPEAAKGRWETWDLDKDSFLSRDEFVFQGKKKPEPK